MIEDYPWCRCLYVSCLYVNTKSLLTQINRSLLTLTMIEDLPWCKCPASTMLRTSAGFPDSWCR